MGRGDINLSAAQKEDLLHTIKWHEQSNATMNKVGIFNVNVRCVSASVSRWQVEVVDAITRFTLINRGIMKASHTQLWQT